MLRRKKLIQKCENFVMVANFFALVLDHPFKKKNRLLIGSCLIPLCFDLTIVRSSSVVSTDLIMSSLMPLYHLFTAYYPLSKKFSVLSRDQSTKKFPPSDRDIWGSLKTLLQSSLLYDLLKSAVEGNSGFSQTIFIRKM